MEAFAAKHKQDKKSIQELEEKLKKVQVRNSYFNQKFLGQPNCLVQNKLRINRKLLQSELREAKKELDSAHHLQE